MSDLDFPDVDWDFINRTVRDCPPLRRLIEYLVEPAYYYFDMREDELGHDGMEAVNKIEKCWSGE